MIEALKNKGEDFSPDLMINAALHILSAWVASSQTTSSTAEREADIKDLLGMLPSLIALCCVVAFYGALDADVSDLMGWTVALAMPWAPIYLRV